ncbi:MAG: hypothetical protein ABIU29_10440, partial [Chthoniobacterales bacterium]
MPSSIALFRRFRRPSFLALLLAPLLAISALAADESPAAPSPSAAAMTENSLLKESTLDFHYPPFDQIKDQH